MGATIMPVETPKERRIVSRTGDLRAEAQAEGDAKQRIVGHAAVFDEWTTLYEGESFVWREIVRPGAFKDAIAENQDVRSLWNHDANWVLGRTTAGTLRLSEDETGLLSDTDPPDTQFARDLMLLIARGDVSQMSFAFTVRRGDETKTTEKDGVVVSEDGGERVTIYRQGNQVIEERELLSMNLFDVSPVTYPAYEQTDVGLRKAGERRESEIRQRVLAGKQQRKPNHLELMRMGLWLAGARHERGVS
jgi:HK97 family phage prohead protease